MKVFKALLRPIAAYWSWAKARGTNWSKWLAFGIPTLLVLSIALACADDVPSAHVSARLAGNGLDIQNLDSFDWPDVQITLNGDWKTQLPVIRARENVTVSLSDFTDKSGFPFAVGVQRVKKVCLEMDLDRDDFRESKTCRDY